MQKIAPHQFGAELLQLVLYIKLWYNLLNELRKEKTMNYLVVVAHPDDEVLGAGATIRKLVDEGEKIAVCIMSSKVSARSNISASLENEEQKVMSMLGVQKVFRANFPNIKMNTVPHLDLVKFVENCIEEWQADAIITHHIADTNNDHSITSEVVQVASRLFQRKPGIVPLKLLLFMEVLSSTEWSLASSAKRFAPNYFVEIGKKGIDVKLNALKTYNGVIREYPHPRSYEAIEALACYRGAQSGCRYAEAFECAFWAKR